MSQPGLTVALLFAALWLGTGLAIIRAALHDHRGLDLLGTRGTRTQGEVVRGPRREGPVVHPAQVRYQAGPSNQTYRRAPLNADHVPDLETGLRVTVHYDPEDPRRMVVAATRKTSGPVSSLWSGVGLCLFGVGLAVWGGGLRRAGVLGTESGRTGLK
ncbi:DUF3592 domain-containing protein [Streptomyces sp. S3(2020)]|uniref:DUF3592 domain-containing protein n=1 Tax=Streptomyces sp. S3(2020) TaxID=2732044 RepID=UPI00148896A8|nr:DUF3592 domain-containing protein [Streptomyces sp. S3(2020)]NNN38224.1 DUF3592 domain-containing protein [Streptomyces sp. S3(2020)]